MLDYMLVELTDGSLRRRSDIVGVSSVTYLLRL